jgi:Branched-chain amino acid ABC-type transport system, permease components
MTTEALERTKTFKPAEWIDAQPHYFLLLLMGALGFLAMIFYSWAHLAELGAEPTVLGALGKAASSWLTMTVAGLAMGLLIFIMASGMTLVFGLMHVLNLGHGAFITLGAFVGASALAALSGLTQADSLLVNLLAIALVMVAAMLVAGAGGLVFERLIVRPVYHDPLKQILVTVGGSIVILQLIIVFWGPNEIPVSRPGSLLGSFTFGDVVIEKYRLLAVVVGLAIYAGMQALINRTRIGLLIRAGVENTEMVENLGYRIRLLFVAVFVAGSALAAVGGVMWALYDQMIHSHLGDLRMVQVIIVIIIGGLGSITGCFYGSLLVGLLFNYLSLVTPMVAEFASIGLMFAVLMWRPQGLIPVIRV